MAAQKEFFCYDSLVLFDQNPMQRLFATSEDSARSFADKFLAQRALIVGAGGLGTPLALLLARMNVGHIVIVDDDRVETSNLGRQWAFSAQDLGESKASLLATMLQQMHGAQKVEALHERVLSHNVRNLMRDCDVVFDCVDNIQTKLRLHDAALALGKTFVYGATSGWNGASALIHAQTRKDPDRGCLRCVFEGEALRQSTRPCALIGTMPAHTMHIASSMVNLWVQDCVLGIPFDGDDGVNRDIQSLQNRYHFFDLRNLKIRKVPLQATRDCIACGPNAFVRGDEPRVL